METSIDDPFSQVFLFIDTMLPPVMFYVLGGTVIVFLLFLSALVSGSEVAFFSLSKLELEECKKRNGQKDLQVLSLIEKPKRLLATILILNNTINVAIVTISTFLSWRIVGSKSTEGVLILILTFSITFFIVFFGEVVPKVYANQNSMVFAQRTSSLLRFARAIFRPLAWVLLTLSNLVEKRVEKKGYHISKDDLHQALELTTANEGTAEEKEILRGIVNFGTLNVKQVMQSRMDITAIDVEEDFHELMDMVNKTGYSRIPVFKETIDKIEGILYIKDLLPFIDNNDDFRWQELLRPGFFIPETKKVDTLLRDFQERHVHMAIVVDEYGGTSGLITLEDVIEEIVGEINDELDEQDIAYNKLDENTYVFEGKTSLNDLCKVVGKEPEIFEEVKGESESVGGLLLEMFSKMPNAGEKVAYDKFVFTIVAVDAKRIKRVRVFIQND